MWGTVFGIRDTKATRTQSLPTKGLQFFLWKCLSCPWTEWSLQIKWWLIYFIFLSSLSTFSKTWWTKIVCGIIWIWLLEVKCFFYLKILITEKNFWSLNKYASYTTIEQSKFRAFENLSLMILLCLAHPAEVLPIAKIPGNKLDATIKTHWNNPAIS